VISGSVEQAAERLRKAVPIMVKHGIPVTPLNYALWYTYVANEDPSLNQRIDDIVAAYGTIPVSTAEDLFKAHISPTGAHETALGRMKAFRAAPERSQRGDPASAQRDGSPAPERHA